MHNILYTQKILIDSITCNCVYGSLSLTPKTIVNCLENLSLTRSESYVLSVVFIPITRVIRDPTLETSLCSYFRNCKTNFQIFPGHKKMCWCHFRNINENFYLKYLQRLLQLSLESCLHLPSVFLFCLVTAGRDFKNRRVLFAAIPFATTNFLLSR